MTLRSSLSLCAAFVSAAACTPDPETKAPADSGSGASATTSGADDDSDPAPSFPGLLADGTTEVGPHGGMLVGVGAGGFVMGCDEGEPDCYEHYSPRMPVTLTHAFFIGETEVTRDQYDSLIADPYYPTGFADCGGDCPRERMDWNMAAELVNAMSAAEGYTECYACWYTGEPESQVRCEQLVDPYACDGYRFPTEAEWEGAARCQDGTLYAGSDDPTEVGWTGEEAAAQTHPVAQKAPNGCGLYDMTGNVREWTHDLYVGDWYTAEGATDPTGGTENLGWHSARGDSHYWGPKPLYPRHGQEDTRIQDDLGLRVARTRF